MFCGKCGANVPEGNSFCISCGAPVGNNEQGNQYFYGDNNGYPMYPNQQPVKKNNNVVIGIIVGVIIAAIIIICIIVFSGQPYSSESKYSSKSSGEKKESYSGPNSPEGVFSSFMDAFLNGDTATVQRCLAPYERMDDDDAESWVSQNSDLKDRFSYEIKEVSEFMDDTRDYYINEIEFHTGYDADNITDVSSVKIDYYVNGLRSVSSAVMVKIDGTWYIDTIGDVEREMPYWDEDYNYNLYSY